MSAADLNDTQGVHVLPPIELKGPTPEQRREWARKGGLAKKDWKQQTKRNSFLAMRLKAAGVDWIEDFAAAIKESRRGSNHERNRARKAIAMWMRLLPYLIVTGKNPKAAKWKGRTSKAAKLALEAMEQEARG